MAGISLFRSVRILTARNATPINECVNGTAALFRDAVGVSPRFRRSVVTANNLGGHQTSKRAKCVTLGTLNPGIKEMEYAVRGPLVDRASEIEKELENGVKKPFTEVIKANIGDCHGMGQVPITFIRQVLALVSYPMLLDDPRFPDDVKFQAKQFLADCPGGSMGSYSESAGTEVVRRHVAEYIETRDGCPSSWEDIVLTSGATEGIKTVLKLLIGEINGKKPGVMTPVPQYPLYSATLSEFNMTQIPYYLDEERCWGLDAAELKNAIDEARKVCNPRAIVIINPGNPTGQVLSRNNIEEIIKFAHQERLFIFADEVYQDNVYADRNKFYSFKKVMKEMGPPYSEMEMASFMSASKGYMGECGLRGGYCEVINLDPEVRVMYLKSITALSCSTLPGQLHLTPKAIKAAEKNNLPPDTLYALELLENTGISVVPGSGFQQKPGTYHFRTTILPQHDKLKIMMNKFKDYHEKFMHKYQ